MHWAGIQKDFIVLTLAVLLWGGSAGAATNNVNTNRVAISLPKLVVPKTHELLAPDAPPLWSAVAKGTNADALPRIGNSLSQQWDQLRAYAKERQERWVFHATVLLLVLFLFVWAGRELRRKSQTEEGLRPAALVFKRPILTALFLALFAGHWIYPEAPPLWRSILGAATLIPAVIVMREFIEVRLRPALGLLILFYFIDQIRRVVFAEETVTRLLSTVEMLTGAVFFGWMIASKRLSGPTGRQAHALRIGGMTLAILFAVAFVANVVGCVVLSNLIGEAILVSAYVGLILVALHRILDAFITSALNVPPLVNRRMIAENRIFLQQRARHLLGWAAVLFWIYFVLGALSIREDAWAEAKSVLAASIQLGSVKFTLGNLLSFAVTMWVATLISSALRFTLREEVYPRVTMAPGLQYSISKVAHYAVLILGLFAALTALGVPLTHLTILASALSVGLGFGLQNIVNNFVSGIILLFERPVKVGDIIVVDSTEGMVTRIGIRASVMRSVNGSDIIIPNGNFISNTVTNWTLSGRQLVINIAVSVAPGINAEDVLNLLIQAAVANAQILKEPPPEAMLLNLTGGSLNFQLRAWADENADWLRVRSDITIAINTAITAKNYTIK